MAPLAPQAPPVGSRSASSARFQRRWPPVALVIVIAAGLVGIGVAAGVLVGLGRTSPPGADSVDAGFARDMSRHHLQSVEMANLALERSADPEVRQLAFDISSTQTNQVGRMQGWLTLWQLPPTGGQMMGWMQPTGDHAAHQTNAGGLMPGMATEIELADLRSLTGPAFDIRFLHLMIRHHQGGADMAEQAVRLADEPAVRSLADSILQAQTAETATMGQMLRSRGAAPLPAT